MMISTLSFSFLRKEDRSTSKPATDVVHGFVLTSSRVPCLFLLCILTFLAALFADGFALRVRWIISTYGLMPALMISLFPWCTLPYRSMGYLLKMLFLLILITFCGRIRYAPYRTLVILPHKGWLQSPCAIPFASSAVDPSSCAVSGKLTWMLPTAPPTEEVAEIRTQILFSSAAFKAFSRDALAFLRRRIRTVARLSSRRLPSLVLVAEASMVRKEKDGKPKKADAPAARTADGNSVTNTSGQRTLLADTRAAAQMPAPPPSVKPALEGAASAAASSPAANGEKSTTRLSSPAEHARPSPATSVRTHNTRREIYSKKNAIPKGTPSGFALADGGMSTPGHYPICQDTGHLLQTGTEEEKIQTVRTLCRDNVPAWKYVPLEQIFARRMEGGLSNTLYAVEVRQESPLHPQQRKAAERDRHLNKIVTEKQELRHDTSTSSAAAEETSKHGCSGGSRRQMDQQKKEVASSEGSAALQHSVHPDKVLCRVFGISHETNIYDPETEHTLFKLLGHRGLAPRCIAEVSGGRIEEWISGQALTVDDLHSRVVQDMIALSLSKLHAARLGAGRLCCSTRVRCNCAWRRLLPSVLFASTSFHEKEQQEQQREQRAGGGGRNRLQLSSIPLDAAQQQRKMQVKRDMQSFYAQGSPIPEECSAADSPHWHRHRQSSAAASSLPQSAHLLEPDKEPCSCSLCRMHAWASQADKVSLKLLRAVKKAKIHAIECAPRELLEQIAAASSERTEKSQQPLSHAEQSVRRKVQPSPQYQSSTSYAAFSSGGGYNAWQRGRYPSSMTPGAVEGMTYESSIRLRDRTARNAGSGSNFRGGGRAAERGSETAGEWWPGGIGGIGLSMSAKTALAKYYAAAAAAKEMMNSYEAVHTLDLPKYTAEIHFLQQAIQRRMQLELSPEMLKRVYHGEKNWLLLSGASPVMSHNDLQENNIMSTPGEIRLIDFEYSSENARAADLGNLFCEMAINYVDNKERPYFTVKPKHFPAPATRLSIILTYLRAVVMQMLEEKEQEEMMPLSADEKEKICIDLVTVEVIENFEIFAKLFALVSHLQWGFWSVLKAPFPPRNTEFDYIEYARQRFQFYDSQKRLFFPNGV